MLDAIKALLFNRGDQFAVANDRRRRIAVICVYAKNVQVRFSNRGFQDPREVSGVEFLLALQTLSRPCWIAATVNDGVNVNGVHSHGIVDSEGKPVGQKAKVIFVGSFVDSRIETQRFNVSVQVG